MSDDLGKTQRPNKKYELSKDRSTDPAEGLTFYYNRERRLEKAPEALRKFCNDETQYKTGLFYSLTADRPRRFLLAIIVLMCFAILVLSIFGYFDKSYSLDNNKIEITAAAFEGTTIVVLKKTSKGLRSYNGAVDIAVSPAVQSADEQYPVFSHRVFFSMENEESYRFAVPFDTPALVMVLQTEKSTLQIKFKSE